MTVPPQDLYRRFISEREFTYFDHFSQKDQQEIITDAKQRLQSGNVAKIKNLVAGDQDSFIAHVSRELRTPLNGLTGTINLMQSEPLSKDQLLLCKTLEQSATYLHSVIDRLQDLATLQSVEMPLTIIPFDLQSTITGIAETMQHFSEDSTNGTQISLVLDPQLPLVLFGDLAKIQQVLGNLTTFAAISSAQKHAKVAATLKRKDDEHIYIQIDITSQEVQAPASILHGIGFEVTRDTLFQPTSYESMAVGLIVCKHYLERMGWNLESHLSESQALTLSFMMKVRYQPGGRVLQADFGELVAKHSSVKILVVEDNRINQAVVLKMLSKLGFAGVDLADNGLRAFENEQREKYNIIFMDCDMPVMNGYTACEKIRTDLRSTAVIIALTANTSNESKLRCQKVGMNDFFTKPITLKSLSEMLHKWLPTVPTTGEKSNKRP